MLRRCSPKHSLRARPGNAIYEIRCLTSEGLFNDDGAFGASQTASVLASRRAYETIGYISIGRMDLGDIQLIVVGKYISGYRVIHKNVEVAK